MNELLDKLNAMDISQEMVIIAVVAIVLFMGDKDIANVAVGGLMGFLAKKESGKV